MSEWKTLRIYSTPKQALDAEVQLHKAGISAKLLEDATDTQTMNFHWQGQFTVGGTQLQVKKVDYKEAAEILGLDSKEADEADEEKSPDAIRCEQAKQTWVYAIVGIFLCPGIMHAYSLLLVITFPASWSILNQKSRQYLIKAAVIDIVVLAIIGLALVVHYAP